MMSPRQQFLRALRREPIQGRVPHFELVFFLTMESIGRVHPSHRDYAQWRLMSDRERDLHIRDMARCYVEIAEKYDHSAIFVHPNPTLHGDLRKDLESTLAILRAIRELSGDKYFLMMHGDPTPMIPDGANMMAFAARMYEEPEALQAEIRAQTDFHKRFSDALARHEGLLDGFALCCDYCFNVNPFFTRAQFEAFVAPYLSEIIAHYRAQGYSSIKHTDGNVMPILDMIVECAPDAVHSLDPQGGVDLAEVKRLYGDRVCLIGNVNCGLMQTGTEAELVADVRRALRQGMPGYGYIFSSSNCAFTGLALERYELMHRIWKAEGIYA